MSVLITKANSIATPVGFNPRDPASIAAAFAALPTNGRDVYGIGQSGGAGIIGPALEIERLEISSGPSLTVIETLYALVLPAESFSLATGGIVEQFAGAAVPVAAVTVAALAPIVSTGASVAVPAAAVAVAGVTPVVVAGISVLVPAAVVAVTALAPVVAGISVLVPAAVVAVTALAPSVTAGAGGDPSFANVVLLLPFDGANNSTTFTDKSNNNLTVTTSGAPIISTAQSKWGGSSLYLNGSSRLQIASNPLFAFNDFTVEMWVYKTGSDDSGRDTVFDLNSQEATIVTGSSLAGRANINGIQLGGTFTTADNTWQHLALVRSGSSCWLFRDGSIIASATISGQLTAGQIYIGDSVASPGRNFIGYVDDLRISNIARYTTGFTPPVAPFPNA